MSLALRGLPKNTFGIMGKAAFILARTAKLLAASGAVGTLGFLGSNSDPITKRILKKYDVKFLDGDLIYGIVAPNGTLTMTVPGFKGSHLIDPQTQKLEYLPFQMLINARKPNLRLKLDPDEPGTERMEASEALQPYAVITRIGTAVDLCHRFFNLMKRREQDETLPYSFRFHSFAYDFRRDNVTSALALEKRIQEIYDANGQQPVTIVGHSMGALLSLHVVNRRPELVRACVFVGAPFRSLRGILKVLNTGDTMLLNADSVSEHVQFTWPSGYAMLCASGLRVFVDQHGNSVDLDLWNPEEWIRRGMTSSIRLAIQERGDEGKDEMRRYMKRVLDKAKEFNATMRQHDPRIAYPPIAIVTADNRSLGWSWNAQIRSDGWIESVDWEKPIHSVPADGTCPTFSMHPPEGVPVLAEFQTTYLHRSMMNDLDAIVPALRVVFDQLKSNSHEKLPEIHDSLSPTDVSHMHDAPLSAILAR